MHAPRFTLALALTAAVVALAGCRTTPAVEGDAEATGAAATPGGVSADPNTTQPAGEATGTAVARATEEATARSGYETRVAAGLVPTATADPQEGTARAEYETRVAAIPPGTPTPTYDGPGELRFDGLYFARLPERTRGYFYLRFYDDGTVLSMSSPSEPTEVVGWWFRGASVGGVGTYRRDGERIEFDTSSLEVKWSYSGTVQVDHLQLGMYSHKNGWHDEIRFGFAEVGVR